MYRINGWYNYMAPNPLDPLLGQEHQMSRIQLVIQLKKALHTDGRSSYLTDGTNTVWATSGDKTFRR